MLKLILALLAALGVIVTATPSIAQNSATDEIAKYRQLLADGNPADLWEMRGEELWKKKVGPT